MLIIRLEKSNTFFWANSCAIVHIFSCITDSDSEPDVEEFETEPETTVSTDQAATNPTTDQDQSSTLEETEVPEIVIQDNVVPQEETNSEIGDNCNDNNGDQ